MKQLRMTAALFLALILSVGALALPACATTTTTTHDGLDVIIEMDKEQYEADESITATITVKNTTRKDITISNLEQLIPEGYTLAKDSDVAKEDVTLAPGKELVLTVTMDSQAASAAESGESSFWDTLIYGKTFGIYNIFLLLLAILAIVIFMLLT